MHLIVQKIQLNIPKCTLGCLKSRKCLILHPLPETAQSQYMNKTRFNEIILCLWLQQGNTLQPQSQYFKRTNWNWNSPLTSSFPKHYQSQRLSPHLDHLFPFNVAQLQHAVGRFCSLELMLIYSHERGGWSSSCSPSPSFKLPAPSAAAEKNHDAPTPPPSPISTNPIPGSKPNRKCRCCSRVYLGQEWWKVFSKCQIFMSSNQINKKITTEVQKQGLVEQ